MPDDVLSLLCALKHLFQGEPQRQMIAGRCFDLHVDTGDGVVQTSLKLEPRYEKRRGCHQLNW